MTSSSFKCYPTVQSLVNATHMQRTANCHTLTGKPPSQNGYCPSFWDGYICWNHTLAGTYAVQPCPQNFRGESTEISGAVSRYCTTDGFWWTNHVNRSWANYTQCVAEQWLDFNFTQRIVWYTGYTLSLVALVIAFSIFLTFRSLDIVLSGEAAIGRFGIGMAEPAGNKGDGGTPGPDDAASSATPPKQPSPPTDAPLQTANQGEGGAAGADDAASSATPSDSEPALPTSPPPPPPPTAAPPPDPVEPSPLQTSDEQNKPTVFAPFEEVREDEQDQESMDTYIDKILDTLQNADRYAFLVIDEADIKRILASIKDLLMSQPMLLEIEAPIRVFGDIHGQFADLTDGFDGVGWPDETNTTLFLGDYVDRGKYGLETIILLFCLKLKYATRMYLLRGNHESQSISRVYGFYEECKHRYSVQMWRDFLAVFDCLPVAALISSTILCMHGGLSPHLNSFDDIRNLTRPIDVPPGGLMTDLLWSDPDKRLDTGWAESPRAVSFIFAADVVYEACKRLDIELIIRAHQVIDHGFEFFADRKMITIFTAPNYCGQFDNLGSIALIDENLVISLTLLNGCKAQDKLQKTSKKRTKYMKPPPKPQHPKKTASQTNLNKLQQRK